MELSCELEQAAPWTLGRAFEQNHRLGWAPGGNGALGSLNDATAAQLVFLLHQGRRLSTREPPGPAMAESSQLSPCLTPLRGGRKPPLQGRSAGWTAGAGLSCPQRSPLFVKAASASPSGCPSVCAVSLLPTCSVGSTFQGPGHVTCPLSAAPPLQ